MTIAPPPPAVKTLTYEEYMAEPEINLRYDIVDGVRIFMSSPNSEHQDIDLNAGVALKQYQRAKGRGHAWIAPFDVLIRRVPKLQTRQPDALFVSEERLAQIGGPPKKGALTVAPELVVEILSSSDRLSILEDKLMDYIEIGVKEAWLIRPETRSVDVLRLTDRGYVVEATYDETQTLQSLVFPDLRVAVADLFIP